MPLTPAAMHIDRTSLLTALCSSTVTSAVTALCGPKVGIAAFAVAFVIQSQMHPIARSASDVRATDAPPSDGEKVQATLVPPGP